MLETGESVWQPNSNEENLCDEEKANKQEIQELEPNGDVPLLQTKAKENQLSNELYKKNLCSVIAGCALVFSSVTVVGLTLVILTK